jgi:CheY-like chemotaxis protein
MASMRDDCSACGNLVPQHQGVAFRDGRIVDLACYIDGPTAERVSHAAPIPANQRLLGVHILVMDDSEMTLDLLRAALEYSGGFVTTVADAAEGRAMLREIHPHVLVTDIAMPHDGLEMVREVIAFAAEKGLLIPAVAISAGADGREHLRDAGFAAFLPKPLDPFVMADVVAKLHQEQRTHRTNPAR